MDVESGGTYNKLSPNHKMSQFETSFFREFFRKDVRRDRTNRKRNCGRIFKDEIYRMNANAGVKFECPADQKNALDWWKLLVASVGFFSKVYCNMKDCNLFRAFSGALSQTRKAIQVGRGWSADLPWLRRRHLQVAWLWHGRHQRSD